MVSSPSTVGNKLQGVGMTVGYIIFKRKGHPLARMAQSDRLPTTLRTLALDDYLMIIYVRTSMDTECLLRELCVVHRRDIVSTTDSSCTLTSLGLRHCSLASVYIVFRGFMLFFARQLGHKTVEDCRASRRKIRSLGKGKNNVNFSRMSTIGCEFLQYVP
jgi:hypothetical protein